MSTDLRAYKSRHNSRFVHTWSNVDSALEEEIRQSNRHLLLERKSHDEHFVSKYKSNDMNCGGKPDGGEVIPSLSFLYGLNK